MVLGTLFVCVPVHTFWDQQNVDENCVSRAVVWYLTAALQIAGDLTLVILPMPKLFTLRVPLRQKVCLILVFALGLLYVSSPQDIIDNNPGKLTVTMTQCCRHKRSSAQLSGHAGTFRRPHQLV
jgi:hypothetical protein